MVINKENMTNPFYTFCLLQKFRDNKVYIALSDIFGLNKISTVDHINNYYNFAKFIYENKYFKDAYYHFEIQSDYDNYNIEHEDGNFPINSDYQLMLNFLYELCLQYCENESFEYKMLFGDSDCDKCEECKNDECLFKPIYNILSIKHNDSDANSILLGNDLFSSTQLCKMMSLRFDIILAKYISQNDKIISYLNDYAYKHLNDFYIAGYHTAYDKKINCKDIMKEPYKNRYVKCQHYNIDDEINKFLTEYEYNKM